MQAWASAADPDAVYGAAACRLHISRGLLGPLHIAVVGDRDPGMLGAERDRRRAPDRAPTPGYKDAAVRQSEIHDAPLVP